MEDTKTQTKTAPLESADMPKANPVSNEVKEVKTETTATPVKPSAPSVRPSTGGAFKPAPRTKNFKKNSRRPRGDGRARSEFDQKIVSIRRVVRVVKGGRRFSFSVAMVIGDKKGKVGVGLGKATDTALAIEKSIRAAKKNMITVKREKDFSIAHAVKAKYNASVVEIRPAPGRGIVVGSSVRDVIELAGVKDVSAKLLSRSKNKINNARAAIKALEMLNS